MSTLMFVAVVKGSQDKGYTANFPDFPACSAVGNDLAQLLGHARNQVTERLRALADAGEAWPTATPLEQVSIEPGAIAILVDIAADDPPVRVNISLGEQLLQRLDTAAETRGMTRSGFIAQAVRVAMGERSGVASEFDAAGRRLQDELSALGRKINESLGPESAFSRRMAELDDQIYDGVRRAADNVSAAMVRRRSAASAAASGPAPPFAADPKP